MATISISTALYYTIISKQNNCICYFQMYSMQQFSRIVEVKIPLTIHNIVKTIQKIPLYSFW